jgi:hypothetical protein
MKVKGLDVNLGTNSANGPVGHGARKAQIASCGVGFGSAILDGREFTALWARDVDAAGDGVLASGVVGVRLLVGASR